MNVLTSSCPTATLPEFSVSFPSLLPALFTNIIIMGASASLNPEVFSAAKAEYESKKNEGLTDEQLFNHMKTFIESKTKESTTTSAQQHAEAAPQANTTHEQTDTVPSSAPPAAATTE